MKKLVLTFALFALFLLWGNKAEAASLELTYPNGGEEWVGGQSYEIKWNHQNLASVAIILKDLSGNDVQNIATVNLEQGSTQGSYNFTVPYQRNGKNYFTVYLIGYPVSGESGQPKDGSNGLFSIKPSLSIELLTDFSKALILDNQYVIKWKFNPDTSYGVNLDLYKDGKKLGNFSSQPGYFAKSNTWDMTYFKDSTTKIKPAEGDNYQINIYIPKSDYQYPIEVFSDNFSIVSYDYDSVVYPGYTLSLETQNVNVGVVYLRTISKGKTGEPYYIDLYGTKKLIGGESTKFKINSDIKITGQSSLSLPVNLKVFGEMDYKKYEYGLLVCSSFDGCVSGSTNSIVMNLSGNGDVDEPAEKPVVEKPVVTFDPTAKPTVTATKVDSYLTNRLRGKILLQVEGHGEAWYVRPDNGKRIYMKDGSTAYGMMRNLGLGITNADLKKIPIGIEKRFICTDGDGDGLCNQLEAGLGTDPTKKDSDGDGHDDGTEVQNNYDPLSAQKLLYNNSLINRLKGRILLQVESRGEAWYINPDDGKRYYMPDGPAAYEIMRFLSLGITDKNLSGIDTE